MRAQGKQYTLERYIAQKLIPALLSAASGTSGAAEHRRRRQVSPSYATAAQLI